MMNVLDATFGHPRGPLGRVGGVIIGRAQCRGHPGRAGAIAVGLCHGFTF